MYDLRIVVDEIRGFCDLPMKPGDYIEVKGGRLQIPDGKFFCLWALQSLMPMIPAKQRNIIEDNDWLPDTQRMVCPDPDGQVIFRFERVPCGDSTGEPVAKSGSVARTPTRPTAAGAQRPAGRAEPPNRLLVNEPACSGCRACELACSFAHDRVYSPDVARISVTKDEAAGLDRPVACRQCGVARCVQACPEGALTRDPATHSVVVDEDRCTGCAACAEACPFGAVRLSAATGRPLICDLCGGSPACVEQCPTGAIRYGRAGQAAAGGGQS
ncbi:MAG: TIGR04076 family protein [Bacillota bacterium]